MCRFVGRGKLDEPARDVNGGGKHRFVLHALDAGAPGSGKDTVKPIVSGVAGGGAAPARPHYVAGGHLVQGDLTTGLQAAISLK
ncbi:MAG TPA: hypothetical protein VHV28_00525 [Solirubrobacteraceae bacterium]|jgi:hypothetical protein|nr:hypothetical protein [Solirubrobacteraceae bacterium]